MLIDNLFSIIRSEQIEQKYLFEVELDAKHPIFKGHFPDVPVLPGVTMMQMVKELLVFSTGIKLQIQKMSNMKFLQMINPKNVSDLKVTIEVLENNDETLKIKAQIIDKETTCFKAQGHFLILK